MGFVSLANEWPKRLRRGLEQARFGRMSGSKSPAPDQDESRLGVFAEVWRSVFPRPIVPRTERERRRTIFDFFVLHLRPLRVRRSTLPYTHTFGLGGSSLVLIGVMIATGVLMMLAYEPTGRMTRSSVSRISFFLAVWYGTSTTGAPIFSWP
jgi:hypothetical protein